MRKLSSNYFNIDFIRTSRLPEKYRQKMLKEAGEVSKEIAGQFIRLGNLSDNDAAQVILQSRLARAGVPFVRCAA